MVSFAFKKYEVKTSRFFKILNDDQVYDHMMKSYDQLGREWIVHQWNWMNNVYNFQRPL